MLSPGIYRHYSGKEYDLIGVGHDSETLAKVVIYQARYDTEDFGPKPIWVRPYDMFIEEVEIDGKMVPRFEWIRE